MTGNAPASYRPAGELVADPLAAYRGPWNARLAAHLARRAGFGGSPADIARLAASSLEVAVDSYVKFPSTDALAAAPELIDDEEQRRMEAFNARGMGGRGFGAARFALTPEMRMEYRMKRREQSKANITWWMTRMLQTPAPLQEKMTLYLHGHFATAENTKGIYGTDIIDQNN